MLTIREQMAIGIFDAFNEDSQCKDPQPTITHEPYLALTEDGYLDFAVPADVEYLVKPSSKASRMDKSNRARKHRQENRRLKTGYSER